MYSKWQHNTLETDIFRKYLDTANPNNPVVILRSRWSLHYGGENRRRKGLELFELGYSMIYLFNYTNIQITKNT